MLTYFRTRYGATQEIDSDYGLNELFTYDLAEGRILLTTRQRPWAILTPQEYDLLLARRIHQLPDVYRTLHDMGMIITRRNRRAIARMYALKYDFLFHPPQLNLIAITNRCNLRCVYCHAEAENVSRTDLDMDEETALKGMDFFLSIPWGRRRSKTIEFQGGETLLCYELICRCMDYVMERVQEQEGELKFSIVSNLTMMQDHIARDIKRRSNVSLSTSWDGKKELHDLQRQFPDGRGSSQKVIYWIERLRTEYGISLGTVATCTRNHLGWERELIDELQPPGGNLVRTMYQAGRGHGKQEGEELGLAPEEKAEFWQRCCDRLLERNLAGERLKEHQIAHLVRNILVFASPYMCMRSPCGYAVSQIAVDYDGSIYGCDASRSMKERALGHVATHTYAEVITEPKALAARAAARETAARCRTCPFSPYCGHCMVEEWGSSTGELTQDPGQDSQCLFYRLVFDYLFRRMLDPDVARILASWI